MKLFNPTDSSTYMFREHLWPTALSQLKQLGSMAQV